MKQRPSCTSFFFKPLRSFSFPVFHRYLSPSLFCTFVFVSLLLSLSISLAVSNNADPTFSSPSFDPLSLPSFSLDPPSLPSAPMSSLTLPLPLPLLEEFALSSSPSARSSLLSQHVDVGSEDHFFLQLLAWQTEDYHLLTDTSNPPTPIPSVPHHQSQPYLSLLSRYRQKFPHAFRLRSIDLRHRLLSYPSSTPEVQQELLHLLQKDYAGVAFDHGTSQVGEGKEEGDVDLLPTRIDPTTLDLPTLLSKMEGQSQQSLSEFLSSSPLSLDVLAVHLHTHPHLSVARKAFLQHLSHPAVPHLVDLIASDLSSDGMSFGGMAIHSTLSLAELDELSGEYPNVVLQPPFVSARLDRMIPDGGVDALTMEEKVQWYEGLAVYVLPLAAVHDDVKANTLFQVLSFRLQQPNTPLDTRLLLAFLALPLILPSPLQSNAQRQKRNAVPQVNAHIGRGPLFPPIQPRVMEVMEEYVQRLYRALTEGALGDDLDSLLSPFLSTEWVHRQRAIARLETVESLSAAEQGRYNEWLGPHLNSERDKQILSFLPSPTSPMTTPAFTVGDSMQLSLTLKNVGRTLHVKVYRIDAATYYRIEGREVDAAALDLGGVVAHYEETIDLPAFSPYHRFNQTFTLSTLLGPVAARGVFVCEVTAKGQKVRALVRRGSLSFLSIDTPNGILVRLFDVDHSANPLLHTRVYVGGQNYDADKNENIVLPFISSQRRQPMVLTGTDSDSGGEYSSLAQFDYPAEDYTLTLALSVDPDSLLAGGQSELVLRPSFILNGHCVPLSLLRKVRVHVRTVHGDGVTSNQMLEEVELKEGMDFVHPFTVPNHLRSLTVTLYGEVQIQSLNEKRELQATQSLQVSTALHTSAGEAEEEGERESLDDLYLRFGSEGFAVFVLGKGGEPIPRRPVTVNLQHRYFREPIHLLLQTDVSGRVLLGPLPHITSVEISTRTSGKLRRRTWQLDSTQNTAVPFRIHAQRGEEITIAYPSGRGLLSSQSFPPAGVSPSLNDLFCLLQVDSADTALVRRPVPLPSILTVESGYIRLQGLEVGRYALLLKAVGQEGSRVDVIIGPSASPLLLNEFLVQPRQVVELANQRATPTLSSITREADGSLSIEVAHATPSTRLHVFASHFVSNAVFSGGQGDMNRPLSGPLLQSLFSPSNVFLRQAALGDETRYILQRKAAVKRVGNMLPRPTLLNNEVERKGTTFDEEPSLKADVAYAPQLQTGPHLSARLSQPTPQTMSSITSSITSAKSYAQSPMQHRFSAVRKVVSAKMHHGIIPNEGFDTWPADTPASIEFLSEPSFRLWNARLDDRGHLLIPSQSLSVHHSHVDVLIVDDTAGGSISRSRCPLAPLQPQQATSSPVPVTDGEQKQEMSSFSLHPHYRDLRHFPSSGPSSTASLIPVVELQRVTPLLPSTSLTIAEQSSASVSVFGSVDEFFHLLHTLTASTAPSISTSMDKFAFLLKWPRLAESEKRSLYSEFACHELHLFLRQRDRPFFDAVVLPFLHQRLHPSVFDQVLMSEDLSHWAEGSQWQQLNVIEQLLLGSLSAGQGNTTLAERIFRSVEQRVQSQPPRPLDDAATRFNVALMVNSLSGTTGDDQAGAEERDGSLNEGTAEGEQKADRAQERQRSHRKAVSLRVGGDEGGGIRIWQLVQCCRCSCS